MSSKIIEFSMQTGWEWFVQLLALFLIIAILAKLLFKPVSEFLDKRQAMIAAEVNGATNAKKDAESLKKDYQSKLVNIEAEASEILKQARAKALVREEEIINEAKKEAEAIKEKAFKDIELEKERVQSEMKQEMIEVATLMASKFVAESMSADKQNALVDDMIKEMGDVQWLR
ncbi:F0F1 ATP synthase subunit B [Niameybacter massiliensis]|uniref:ATP synthase subunit b n=1 Tax=Holtiella tumoricola TaxID=3018743 RepID=A0AA42J293_9FIRM|nr:MULTISPECIES: F0F1 ATP synthase subunit B [Lachnospirales]MDA3733367.1 F0F1 ATP synthase subunit B [Holtiella tumoricola]